MITREKTDHIPPEGRGGLLADEMGVGKILSLLALVVHTLAESSRFYRDPAHQRRTGATLIVTPKTSECAPMVHGKDTDGSKQYRVGSLKFPSKCLSPFKKAVTNEWLRHLRSDNGLRYVVYHGDTTYSDSIDLQEKDIVLTTYETLVSRLKSGDRKIDGLAWFRVVLDEAHAIRNSSTLAFKFIRGLDAERRWCLTGTPVQNDLKDLFSLIKFLRLSPFDEDAVLRKHIQKPLQEKNRKGLDNLRILMQSFSLRRTAETCNIVAKNEVPISVELSVQERDEYKTIRAEGQRKLLESSRTKIHESGRILFQTIGRLRQLCSYGINELAGEISVNGRDYPSKLLKVLFHITQPSQKCQPGKGRESPKR